MYKKSIASARKDKAKATKLAVTPQTLLQYKEAFDAVDADGSGGIDETELRLAMTAIGFEVQKDEVRKMIKGLDTDCDGSVNFQEFIALMGTKAAKKDPKQQIKAAFGLFDKSNKGFINMEDIQAAAKELGETVSEETLQAMLDMADVDGDGKVDGQDFYKTLRKTSF